MSDTITLDALAAALVWEAGIDGKAGPNARHDLGRIYELLNRKYKQLRSLVAQNGEDFFRVRAAADASVPADEAEYIELEWPIDADEIISVEVRIAGVWYELTPSSRRQWRVFPGANRPGSPGEWSTVRMPHPDGPDDVTLGAIAAWPVTLPHDFAIDYVEQWSPISEPTDKFIVFPHWEEWLLSSCAMVICQRDNNKRNMFASARDRMVEAQAQIIAHCRRSKRGSVVARRRDGLEL